MRGKKLNHRSGADGAFPSQTSVSPNCSVAVQLVAEQKPYTTAYELSLTLPMLLTRIARGMRSVKFSIC